MVTRARNALYRSPPFVSDLSERQYAAIGKVACEWAHLEFTMHMLVAEFSGIERTLARKFTADMQAKPIMELLLTLAHQHENRDGQQPPLWQHLKRTLAVIDDLRARRNDVVHRDWTRNGRGRLRALKISARGSKLHATLKESGTRDIELLAAQIADAHQKLWEIAFDHERGQLAPIEQLPVRKARRARGVTPLSWL